MLSLELRQCAAQAEHPAPSALHKRGQAWLKWHILIYSLKNGSIVFLCVSEWFSQVPQVPRQRKQWRCLLPGSQLPPDSLWFFVCCRSASQWSKSSGVSHRGQSASPKHPKAYQSWGLRRTCCWSVLGKASRRYLTVRHRNRPEKCSGSVLSVTTLTEWDGGVLPDLLQEI